jgi:hypothetical protein
LGTDNLKLFKGSYYKKIPFGAKEYKAMCKTGLTPEIKSFWNDIDFNI